MKTSKSVNLFYISAAAKTVPKNTIKASVTCNDPKGCRIPDTSTVLFWGDCCVSIQYALDQNDPNVNNTDYTSRLCILVISQKFA